MRDLLWDSPVWTSDPSRIDLLYMKITKYDGKLRQTFLGQIDLSYSWNRMISVGFVLITRNHNECSTIGVHIKADRVTLGTGNRLRS